MQDGEASWYLGRHDMMTSIGQQARRQQHARANTVEDSEVGQRKEKRGKREEEGYEAGYDDAILVEFSAARDVIVLR
jgi:hypothetical protein